ncbi:MAG: hypothetical protein LCH53_04395 [Bacteroidetes bacterium]|nr:hypothetical protein [Bacteroidota bacterium]
MPEPNANTGYQSDKTGTKDGSSEAYVPLPGEYVMPETDVWSSTDKSASPKKTAPYVPALSRISPIWLVVAAAGVFFLVRLTD